MGWYQVVKTIKGNKYLYLQMTRREGGKVKTYNRYLGPLNGGFGRGPDHLPRAAHLVQPKEKPLAPIRRLTPKDRDTINREAALRRFAVAIIDNRKELRRAKKIDEDVSQLEEISKIYRQAWRRL